MTICLIVLFHFLAYSILGSGSIFMFSLDWTTESLLYNELKKRRRKIFESESSAIINKSYFTLDHIFLIKNV